VAMQCSQFDGTSVWCASSGERGVDEMLSRRGFDRWFANLSLSSHSTLQAVLLVPRIEQMTVTTHEERLNLHHSERRSNQQLRFVLCNLFDVTSVKRFEDKLCQQTIQPQPTHLYSHKRIGFPRQNRLSLGTPLGEPGAACKLHLAIER
jgi:hypothetical protein